MEIPKASIDRIMRRAGAFRLSEKATEEMGRVLEDIATDLTEDAVKWAKYAGRKTIKLKDVKMAVRG